MYKNGPGRPRKLRIRAVGEEGARKRRRGVYHCTTCNSTSHNAKSCKATEQDPNSLKRKVNVDKLFVSDYIRLYCVILCLLISLLVYIL
jgi:hypothetical protein